jgi:RHS repeat-associated protein
LFGVACSPVVTGDAQVCFAVGEQYVSGGGNGNAVLLRDSEGVVTTGTPLAPPSPAYSAEAYGGGSPSEVDADQNIWVGSGADPVNTATGDASYSATDLTVPGPGVPLQFTRTYDAQAAAAQVQEKTQLGVPVPPLGYGWSDNLNMTLLYNSGTVTITEEDGSQISFVPIAGDSNSWCNNLTTNFCPTDPRVEATLNETGSGTTATWTLTRMTGYDDTFTFVFSATLSSGDTWYVLNEIQDPTNDKLLATTYTGNNPSCPAGDSCTVWTSTPSGGQAAGQLVLATSANQLSEIFVPGASTQQVSYSYSGTGCTWGGELCAVTDLLGNATGYTYDGPSLYYDLSTVTPPGGIGSYSNTYNSSGQVTEQTNPVTGDTTNFYYGTGNGGLTTTTESVYGSGSTTRDETEFDYSYNLLTAEVSGIGTGNPGMESMTRSSSVLLDTSDTDPDHNTVANTYQTSGTGTLPYTTADLVKSVDGVGDTTKDDYANDTPNSASNSYNQVWCSVDAADSANGVTCPNISPPASIPSQSYPGRTINVYNSSDELTATIDPLGNTTAYAYTPSGDGVPVGLMYCSVDPVEYKAGVACPAYGASHVTGTTTETLNSSGYMLTSTDADGHTTSYTYSTSNPGLIATETAPDGTVTSYRYDAAGHALLTTVSFGSYSATTQVAYDGSERQFCEVDPYEYSKGVRCPALPITTPTPSSDLYLGTTITTYNADSQVTQVTNPLGGITYTAYDDAGQSFCSVDPYEAAQGVTCPSVPPSSPPTIGNDPYHAATITSYNAEGEESQVTNPLGGITLSTYDPAGNLSTTTVESNDATADPNLVTAYSYDADNDVTETTVGYGSSSPATTLQYYDPNGNVFCSVSANAYKSGTYQCPTWQTGWIAAPPSPTALYSTTPSQSQANNVTTEFDNADGDEVQTTNPDVETSVSAFDADGRTYCTSDPVNVGAWLTAHPSATYPYLCPSAPPGSPPAQGSKPGYTTTIYDPAGLTTSATDQLGDTTTYAYDSAGLQSSVTDPSGSATDYCYYYQTGSGNCAASAPAGGGAGSDQYSQLLPSGATTTYTYYPGGASDTTNSPAGTTTDSYDALGDLTAETYSNTASGYSTPPNLSYAYYLDGSRETMTDGTGTTTYTPDAMGDVTSQAFSAGSGSGLSSNTIGYGYFTTGQLASEVYPTYGGHSSPTVTYTYDALGNMASETDWLSNEVTFTHDGDGNLTSQDNEVSGSNPNGTSGTGYSYDNADYNTAATSSLAQSCGGAETLAQSFSGSTGSRDADGQVTEDSEAYTGSCTGQVSLERNYSYDLAGRVVYQGSVAQGSSGNNFAYSAAGFPTEISSHVSSWGNFDTYGQTHNSSEAVTGQTLIAGSGGANSTYGYDAMGDLTSSTSGSSTTNYSYDSIAQMTGLTNTAGWTSYQYTGDGLEAAASSQARPTWGAMTNIDGAIGLWSVSCASSSFCAAVDDDGNALTYNGSSWSEPDPIDGTVALDAVSCPTSTYCMAIDVDGSYLTYDGRSWANPVGFDVGDEPTSVSCISSSWCMAVDDDGIAWTWNGARWTQDNLELGTAFYGVSCTSSSFCVAVDDSGNALTDTSGTWTTKSIDGSYALFAVSCASSIFCVAVDSDGNALTDTSGTWTTKSIDGTNALSGVSCVSSSFCVADDGVGNVLTYNGSTWPKQSIDGTNEFTSASCTSSTFCAVIDADGNAGFYSEPAPAWGAAKSIDGSNTVWSVSCASSSFCAAVDYAGNALMYNGTSWTEDSGIDQAGVDLVGVSCPASTFCMAVDWEGYYLTYNGIAWTTPALFDTSDEPMAVSCTSSSWCMAVTGDGIAWTWNPTNGWTENTAVETGVALTDLSCTSLSFCAAVDDLGNAWTYKGGTNWTEASSLDGTNGLFGVSCTSSSFCVAVDSDGNEFTYNGSSWSKQNIDGTNEFGGVSCVSSSFCVAVDTNGNELTYNGSSWSSPKSIDGTNFLTSVSCASSTFGVAVDSDGNAVVYSQAAPVAEQLIWDTSAHEPLVMSDGTNYYVYGATGEPVEQVNVTSSKPLFLTYTPSDSSWLATNAVGDELGFWRYDAFGTLALGTPDSPFGYAGQYTDTSSDPSGFDNMRARWYMAQTGQFTSVDPALAQTDQAYDYAGGDPVNSNDPSGLWPCKWPNNGEGPPASSGGPCGSPNDVTHTGTEGFCVSGTASFLIAGGQVSLCLVRTTNHSSTGLTLTGGLGWGFGLGQGRIAAVKEVWARVTSLSSLDLLKLFGHLFSATGGAVWQTSNATSISELAHEFRYGGFTFADDLAFGWDSFKSLTSHVSGTDWSLGFGAGISFLVGHQWTKVVRMFPRGSTAARVANDELSFLQLVSPISWFYSG